MHDDTTLQSTPAIDREAAPAPAGRHDLYAGIHKALRLFMSRTLCRMGSTDPGNADEVAGALDMVARLLAICELHLKHENESVHPALERARPGSAARIAAEHVHHLEAIADLRELGAVVAASTGSQRVAACGRLYRALALFVAENFQHMHVEETAHNAVLWAHCSDAELAEVEHGIVASIAPPAMMEMLHWFLPGLNAPERALMLGGMRAGGMPAEAFEAVLGIAQRTLSPDDDARLRRALGLPVAPGLMAA